MFLYALSMTGRSEHPEETRMLQQVSLQSDNFKIIQYPGFLRLWDHLI